MFKLAWRLFPKMLRGRTFNLLLSALIVATASITAISLFIERINNTLTVEAASFIAADAKVSGSLTPHTDWLKLSEDLQLLSAQYQQFSAMLFANDSMQLAQIKAVSHLYPLRGELVVGTADGSNAQPAQSGPKAGTVWLAPRLFNALGISLGDKVKIGEAEFIAQQAIIKEPDNTRSIFGVAPRVMMHINDVEQTQAIQLGSRVRYALLLAGDSRNIERFKKSVVPELGEHYRWVSPEQGSEAFNSTLQKAQRFLLLAGSLSVILSGVAIALAAHRFALVQQTQVALLKTFGVKPKQIQQLYFALLAILGTAGFLIGSAVGWVLHKVIIVLLGNLLPQTLASASAFTLFIGAATSLIALFAFAAPPLFALKNIAPAKIFRQESGKHHAVLLSAAIGIAATALLIWLYSRDLTITSIILGGLLLCIVVSALAAHVLLNITQKLQGNLRSFWRLGLANLQRQRNFTALQIFVFATVGLLVLVLFQVRTNLIGAWKPQLAEAPNHFIFNIFDDELNAIRTELTQAKINASDYYAMSRGRLISINGTPTKERILPNKRGSNYQRELNLTSSPTLGDDNKIVRGTWWQSMEQGPLKVSAEQQYAEGLGLKIGDILHFSVAGREFDAELSSVRSVQWDSMNPNFYMIFDRPVAGGFATNWITSFYLPPEQKPFVNQLLKKYPTISLIELDQTLALIKEVVSRVSMAIEFILALVLAASTLVLLTSIQSTLDERKRESALLRSFGANRQFVQRILLVEFFSIGWLAGAFASLGAEACLYFIQVKLFDMPFSLHLGMWATAPWLSAVFISVVGYTATVSATHIPPMQILRLK